MQGFILPMFDTADFTPVLCRLCCSGTRYIVWIKNDDVSSLLNTASLFVQYSYIGAKQLD